MKQPSIPKYWSGKPRATKVSYRNNLLLTVLQMLSATFANALSGGGKPSLTKQSEGVGDEYFGKLQGKLFHL
jgi:hypothetical protein